MTDFMSKGETSPVLTDVSINHCHKGLTFILNQKTVCAPLKRKRHNLDPDKFGNFGNINRN